MNSLPSLLRALDDAGVELVIAGDRLRYRAPAGALTPELKAEASARKHELIALLRASAPVESADVPPDLIPDPDARFEPFPLTDVQQAYWIGRSGTFQLGTVSTHGYCELDRGGLDVPRLEAAWRILVARHDMLRAIVTPSGWQQVLRSVPPYRIQTRDLRGAPAVQAAQALAAIRAEMSHQVLPAHTWPLFDIRASLLDGRVRVHIGFDALICDVASVTTLFREWARLYADPAGPLPPLGVTFRDYVVAQRRRFASGLVERSKRYWMDRLDTLAPAPELPLRVDPDTITTPRFERHEHRLTPAQWRALRDRASRLGVTPSVTVLTAFALVLSTWSKSSRLTINLTLFDRQPVHPEIGGVIGDFTSLTLLEVDHRRREAFVDQARRLQEQLWRDLDHSAFTGVRVLRELARRSAARTRRALMPVVFTSTLGSGSPNADAEVTELLGDVVHAIGQTPQVWLDHQLFEQDGALVATWDYIAELFPDRLIDDMFGAYRDLLTALADRDGAWTDLAPVELPGWQAQSRDDANATEATTPALRLESLVYARALAAPSQIAVAWADGELSYGALVARSDALAAQLSELGAGPGTVVAVAMDKGWEAIVALLAALRTGAAYVPVDPALPRARRDHLIAETEARLLITQAWRVDGPDRVDWPPAVRVLTVPAELPAAAAFDPPYGQTEPVDDLAYVIFTSGSTGRPKGVMIDHRGAVNTVDAINARFAVGPGDRVLAVSSFSFDLSVYDVFGTLAAGATIVLPNRHAGTDPREWAERITAQRVTIWSSVPALMGLLTDHIEAGADAAEERGPLRLVMLSGDWIPVALPDRIRRLWPAGEVVSLGGATEASIWSIAYPIDEVDPSWTSIPYGTPLRNQTFHVLDESLRPKPVWVTGELYIGGAGLALGYWRDAARTEAAFVTLPDGERLYRTGDFGRYLPSGKLEFLGREDLQVKLHGHRIELGEVEATIARHPGIAAAVAGVIGPRDGRRTLVSWVVPEASYTGEVVETDRADETGTQERWHRLIAAAEAAPAAAEQLTDDEQQALLRFWDGLDRAYVGGVCRALGGLGLFTVTGELHDVDDILERGGIAERYRRWLARALGVLVADGALERAGDAFAAARPLARPSVEAIAGAIDRAAARALGHTDEEIDAFADLAANVIEILTERRHSATIYAGPATTGVYAKLFGGATALIADTVAAFVDTSGDGPLHVLEVGAGYGTTTQHLLAALPGARTTYDYTDISSFFADSARALQRTYPFVRYGRLDIERSPATQGYEPGSYDLVIAVSMLHDTRDIGAALGHVRDLLAPGGVMIVLEQTAFRPSFDLGMGLQQGFDAFEDHALRRDHPLLDRSGWVNALAAAGFPSSAVLRRPGTACDILGFDVLAAQAPAEHRSFRPDALAGWLRGQLPAYMIPSRVVALDRLPLSANGKVDRQALPAPDTSQAARRDEGSVAPRTPVERALVEIFGEVLAIEAPGVHDGFFELGGDSLLATRLTSAIQRTFGVALPLQAVFDFPTVAGLSCELSPDGEMPAASDPDDALAAAIASLSEAEIAEILAAASAEAAAGE